MPHSFQTIVHSTKSCYLSYPYRTNAPKRQHPAQIVVSANTGHRPPTSILDRHNPRHAVSVVVVLSSHKSEWRNITGVTQRNSVSCELETQSSSLALLTTETNRYVSVNARQVTLFVPHLERLLVSASHNIVDPSSEFCRFS